MGLFSKPVYIEVVFPFRVIEPTPEEKYACLVDVEASGYILDVRKYFTASLSFKSKDYDELIAMLKTAENKRIKLIVKTKNGIVKNFKIDFKYLSELINDSRFEKVSIAVWGISDEKKS